ncbi:hypothetical protein OVA10_13530 [Lelliottia sp. SL45]|uniref:hypothetical protein n=1 Tax=Lelliottia sp. SL45 TaxID=2994665 RepID=UPI002272F17C|nr:hypothetical protein [Lelliottia sp. SL45]MCY1699066.1 hypothetical protein [Lelliottia sp. SL45]
MHQSFVSKHNYAQVSNTTGPTIVPANPPSIMNLNFPLSHFNTFVNAQVLADVNGMVGVAVAMQLDTTTSAMKMQVVSYCFNMAASSNVYPLVALGIYDAPVDHTGVAANVRYYPIKLSTYSAGACSAEGAITVDTTPVETSGNQTYAALVFFFRGVQKGNIDGFFSMNQVLRDVTFLQPLK